MLLMALAPLLVAAGDPPLPADQETEHVVKPGETLGGIAQRASVPRVLSAEANHLTSPYALRAGQKLTIPRTRRHIVARGDSRFTIAYLYGVPWQDIAVASGIEGSLSDERRPQIVIAETVKGKGVDFMEDQASWHYGALDSEAYHRALASVRRLYEAHGL